MLLNKFIKSYWYIGVLLYLLIAIIGLINNDSFLYLAIALISFLLFGIVMVKIFTWKREMFTATNLFFVTLLCSILVVFCNHQLSLYMEGDQFLFSKDDALLYFKYANRLADSNIKDWIGILGRSRYGIDDWGAFMTMGAIFSIAKSQTLFAFVNCLFGSLTALNIFYIGRGMMSRRYAFICAISFSIASYILTWHGVFLKETLMVYVIIAAFRMFYAFVYRRNGWFLVFAYLIALLILFFRTPVALLTIVSFTITLLFKYVNKAFLPIVVVLGFIALTASSTFVYTYDRYMAGGDVERMVERKNSLSGGGGLINQITDPIAALFGPFPSVVEGKSPLAILNSSGLIFRMLIVLPFILGFYYVVRYKQLKLYPLAFFFLVNAIGIAISVKGLEVRLSIPHLFSAYLIAFWWMANYDYKRFYFNLSPKMINLFIGAVIGMSVLWNLRQFV